MRRRETTIPRTRKQPALHSWPHRWNSSDLRQAQTMPAPPARTLPVPVFVRPRSCQTLRRLRTVLRLQRQYSVIPSTPAEMRRWTDWHSRQSLRSPSRSRSHRDESAQVGLLLAFPFQLHLPSSWRKYLSRRRWSSHRSGFAPPGLESALRSSLKSQPASALHRLRRQSLYRACRPARPRWQH